MITTERINETIQMMQILRESATGCAYIPSEGKSTILKGITLDSFLFVMDRAMDILNEVMKNE